MQLTWEESIFLLYIVFPTLTTVCFYIYSHFLSDPLVKVISLAYFLLTLYKRIESLGTLLIFAYYPTCYI